MAQEKFEMYEMVMRKLDRIESYEAIITIQLSRIEESMWKNAANEKITAEPEKKESSAAEIYVDKSYKLSAIAFAISLLVFAVSLIQFFNG
ncbi:hypothetical protein DXA97_13525 [Clostridium sp. OF09-36]|uniref:hypothetical protein n=1 Tax=Clostridium sp. OF09-36 TaxID=2292310 RepID=UPI000E4E1D85|nr:hypothetical protein [Clostridium sp. OF09-36]RHV86217.1 hypothetical protein DXA97_13525 [Clostridium sp. OF09-36]